VAELGGRPVAVSGSGDRTVRVWDRATGLPIGDRFTGHTDAVNALAVARLEGRPVVVSGSSDRTVRVWDLATGQLIGRPFTGHTSWVRSVAVARLEGRLVVVSGSSDQTVRVWDLATGQAIGEPLTGHTSYVTSVAVAELEGHSVVVSGSSDETVRVWDLRLLGADRRRPSPIRLPHPAPVLTVSVTQHSGELRILTGCADNISRTWRLPSKEVISRVSISGQSGINAITTLTSGHVLYAGGPTIYLHKSHDSVEPILAIQLDSEILAMTAHNGAIIAATGLGLVELEIRPLRPLQST